jgi:LysR family transcriptional regulator (chromosome initiation inhibitor)
VVLPALTRVPPEMGICFELHRADESQTTVLLREGLVMAAVTSSPDPVQGCSVRQLGHMRFLPAATPSFVRRWLSGPLRELLPDAPVVLFDRHDDLQDRFTRQLTGDRGASGLRHYVPSSEGHRDAVVAGMGWGMVPSAQAAAALRAGRLVALAPDSPIDVPLFWQQWKLDSPVLAAAADAIASAAEDALGPVTPGR